MLSPPRRHAATPRHGADIARRRNERARAAREAGREERARQLLLAVGELHAGDSGSAYTLDQLREATRAEQERHRRRRERVERQEREESASSSGGGEGVEIAAYQASNKKALAELKKQQEQVCENCNGSTAH